MAVWTSLTCLATCLRIRLLVRGYRDAMHVAALRETLAAAMLIYSGTNTHSTAMRRHAWC